MAICDQDDVWHSTKIEKQVNLLLHKQACLCYHITQPFYDQPNFENSNVIEKWNYIEGENSQPLFLNNRISGHRKHDTSVTVKPQQKTIFYPQVIHNCSVLLTCPSLKPATVIKITQLQQQFGLLKTKNFSFKLFKYLLANAKGYLGFKKRKLPWLSYLKLAFRHSFAKYKQFTNIAN